MGWAANTKHSGESKTNEALALSLDTQQLRALARQIEDEAHLQCILDTVTETVIRVEIEKVLRPMLLFPPPAVE